MTATDVLGALALALVVVRMAWLVLHQPVHHLALQPAHWSRRTDRVLHGRSPQHRA